MGEMAAHVNREVEVSNGENEGDGGGNAGGMGEDFGDDGEGFDSLDEYLAEAESAPTPKQSKQKAKTPKAPAMLTTAPFQIEHFDEAHRSYGWIGTWTESVPPGPEDLLRRYGAGRYKVKDATGTSVSFRIHVPPGVAPPEPETLHVPNLSPPSFQPQPQRQGGDPYVAQAVYRIDAAIQALGNEMRRLGDEVRSLRYDAEQAPGRTAERVAVVMKDAADPFDQSLRMMELARNLAGDLPSQAGGDDSTMAAVMGALPALLGGLGGAAPTAPPAAPAQAPEAPRLQAVPEPTAGLDGVLPGLTPQILAELRTLSERSGRSVEEAVAYARAHGWDAPTLLRLAAEAAVGPSPAPEEAQAPAASEEEATA